MAGPHWTERESATRQKYQSLDVMKKAFMLRVNKKQLVLNTSWIEGEAPRSFNVAEGDVSLEEQMRYHTLYGYTCSAGLPNMYQM